jgi:hypothetical protein
VRLRRPKLHPVIKSSPERPYLGLPQAGIVGRGGDYAPIPKYPILGILLACCARPAHDHAVAPASVTMNSRRRIWTAM